MPCINWADNSSHQPFIRAMSNPPQEGKNYWGVAVKTPKFLPRSHSNNECTSTAPGKDQNLLCPMFLVCFNTGNSHRTHRTQTSRGKSRYRNLWQRDFSMMQSDHRDWYNMSCSILFFFFFQEKKLQVQRNVSQIVKSLTVATKSPRLGPLTNHSLTISSTLNRRT